MFSLSVLYIWVLSGVFGMIVFGSVCVLLNCV